MLILVHLGDTSHREIFKFRKENGIMPVYKMVDTLKNLNLKVKPLFYMVLTKKKTKA